MKRNQNTTAFTLMLASILLLAASQYFWLKSEYKDHKRAFYTNSNLLFKETVRSLEDSLLSRSIVKTFRFSENDSIQRHGKNEGLKIVSENISTDGVENIVKIEVSKSTNKVKITTRDSSRKSNRVLVKGNRTHQLDTFVVKKGTDIKLAQDSSSNLNSSNNFKPNNPPKVLKVISGDSLRKTRRLLAQMPNITIVQGRPDNKSDSQFFRRRFEFRSASLDSVEIKFNKKVSSIGYNVSFSIKKDSIPIDTVNHRNYRQFSEMHKMMNTSEDSVIVNGVSMLNPEKIISYSILPNVMFEATAKDLNRYLLTKLTRNFIFSCFLLLITGLAFYFIYRNLQRQTRLNVLKNDLISNVSHELKTPLATLSVALEALLQFGGKENPELTKEYLTISRNEVSRLSLMVDNILKASLLEKESVSINSESLNIKDLLEEVVLGWQLRFQQLEGSIELISTGQNFMLVADQVQIGGVINNLIDNAVKYSNGIPNVKISLLENSQQLIIKIADNGIGIPKEYRSQVFEKFFRVPTGDKHNVKGYGLGLNFVKHIMELHHGDVSLKSNENGSEFELTFNRAT